MEAEEMQDRIDELEAKVDDLQDQLDTATTQLVELRKLGDEARDHVRFAHELLEKGDF